MPEFLKLPESKQSELKPGRVFTRCNVWQHFTAFFYGVLRMIAIFLTLILAAVFWSISETKNRKGI